MNQLKRGTNGVWFWTLSLLLLTVTPSHQWTFGSWFGGGYKGELSHFAGAFRHDDILCAKRLVGRGTRLPINIPFTTSIPIRAYSAEANEYNSNGFQVGVRSGNLNTNTVTLFIAGPRTLPYYVIVDFYCTP